MTRCSAPHDVHDVHAVHAVHAVQVVVFDLEFGQPAASTSLPSSRPPFRDVLGCFGHQAVGKDVSLGGIDLLYCSHQVTYKQPGSYFSRSLHCCFPAALW